MVIETGSAEEIHFPSQKPSSSASLEGPRTSKTPLSMARSRQVRVLSPGENRDPVTRLRVVHSERARVTSRKRARLEQTHRFVVTWVPTTRLRRRTINSNLRILLRTEEGNSKV